MDYIAGEFAFSVLGCVLPAWDSGLEELENRPVGTRAQARAAGYFLAPSLGQVFGGSSAKSNELFDWVSPVTLETLNAANSGLHLGGTKPC